MVAMPPETVGPKWPAFFEMMSVVLVEETAPGGVAGGGGGKGLITHTHHTHTTLQITITVTEQQH